MTQYREQSTLGLNWKHIKNQLDCNLKCPFFLHVNFPMVLSDQKLLYLIKKEIFKEMTHS